MPAFGPVPSAQGRGGGNGALFVILALVGLLVVGGGVVAALVLFTRGAGTPTPIAAPEVVTPQGAWSDMDAAVPVSSEDPTWGDRAAPVTIVVFSDFQCPFCSRVEMTFSQLKETYGPQKLRIVWKNNPLAFHVDAKPAAIAGEAVFRAGGSAAFWKFHAAAFRDQKSLNQTSFQSWAAAAGVDAGQFAKWNNDPAADIKVSKDMQLGKTLGVTGTPASYVNGIFVSGAQPIEKFKTTIDDQLRTAATLTGVSPDRVYVKLTNDNFAKAPPPSTAKAAAEVDDKVYTVPVGDSPSRGPASAPVTIVEFSDFQCPFCSRAEKTLDEVEAQYKGKVRIVWKNKPLAFHKQALPAAVLALEARAQKGDKGFWDAHAMLFANQKNLTDEDLQSYAAPLGLNAAQVKAALAAGKHKATIDADSKLADELGVSGTPTFFINGRKLVGAQPAEKFREAIDRALGGR